MSNESALLKKALEPKSDQLNADDLISGDMEIVIRKVAISASGEQRISLYYHGDDNKPYKPGKAMGRVIMEAWGDEPVKWIAQALRLYRDPSVKFGKDQVGGIRISHMTGIKETTPFVMTTKKGERKPHIVKPLVMKTQQAAAEDAPAGLTEAEITSRQAQGRSEAAKGADALKAWWMGQKGNHGKLGGEVFLAELKEVAAKVAPETATQNSDPVQTSAGDDEVPFDV